MVKVKRLSRFKSVCVVAGALMFAQIPLALADVSVNINIDQPEHHLAKVAVHFDKFESDVVDIKLPTWRTGRYEILNLANAIRDFKVTDGQGNTLTWQKIDKSTWQVQGVKNKKLQVSYQVYANELGQRTRHIDDSHAFIDASTVVMYTDSNRNDKYTVTLKTPTKWNSVSGLTSGKKANQFIAKNYDVLVDSPIETGINEHYKFTVEKRKYELVIWGKGNFDSEKIVADLKSMVKQTKHIWQGYPFKRYVFMVHATGGARGATEHLNSTIIQRSRFKFSSRKDYLGFISTAAHEFVHTWNVKQYRPEGLVPYDYQKENYATLLWVSEGSTSYLQNQLLARGDIITSKELLDDLAKRITGYQHKPGRKSQSVAEASFNKWIDQGGDYGTNHSVNIYSEGFLVSWMLDFSILEKTKLAKSYRDVHNELYQNFSVPKSFNEADMLGVINTITHSDYSQWWQKNVHGYADPNFNQLLAKAGLTMSYGTVGTEKKVKQTAWAGIKTKKHNNGLEVIAVEKNSPAWKAGLTLGDIIVAVDGLRMADSDLIARMKNFKPADNIVFTFFRRDQLTNKTITVASMPTDKLKVIPLENANEQQKAFFKAWSGLDFPSSEK